MVLPDKHLYGQAFALYALTEYALATHDEEASRLADDLVETLETHAHDAEFGGYREYFRADWTAVPADSSTFFYRNFSGPDTKLMNTHMHL